MRRHPAQQLAEIANIYTGMGVMFWSAACQWPFLFAYPHRKPMLRLIQGGRA